MRYGIIKLQDEGLTSYNIDIFDDREKVIAFPLEEFQLEIMRLKYYLEKSGEMSEMILKGRVRYKKQGIKKVGVELNSAAEIIDSLTHFNLQTSLEDYYWPELKVKKRKRIVGNDSLISPIIIGEGAK
ncbi:hypothetical protein [Methanobacterium alcaliphilum]|uniref:hypothetical protein n=1 Tax=Methanobacterium alcaliphilum TaxID=392018 RepID=UPI00200A89C4|nr:hypothetical protein [Methanobacterium alcaliphilum]MCK9150604.1 hypothetical protein [Methanobacterium alcaliphilum]